ncbi:MAG: alkaline phosphatase family protein [Acidobacteria bacterium]|nr:alkaline phosphatase family protein [Acidobacteriota bacterium]
MPTKLTRFLFYIAPYLLFPLGMNLAQRPAETPKATPTLKPAPPKISSHVVMILVSGLGADLLNAGREQLPKLNAAMVQGVVANAVEGVYPSLTQPAQATIATGMLPADHGIYSNDNNFAAALKLAVEPQEKAKKNVFVWESASKAGLNVAAIGYKLTTGATIKFNYPDYPKQSLNEPTANKKRKSDVYTQALNMDEQRAQKACELIEAVKPNLLLINFRSLYWTQSQFGIRSKEVDTTLQHLDSWIEQILTATEKAKTRDQTTFLVVSDTGMAAVENEFNPNVVLAKKGWLTVDTQGNIAAWKAVAQALEGAAAIFVKSPADEQSVEKIFREIHQIPDSPVWRIFTRQELSRMATLPQAALMLDTAPNYMFGTATKGNILSKTSVRAATGFSPQRLEMRPVFIAFGKGIEPKGSFGLAHLTDVAPSIARILGIQHPTSRGKVLTELLQP